MSEFVYDNLDITILNFLSDYHTYLRWYGPNVTLIFDYSIYHRVHNFYICIPWNCLSKPEISNFDM